MYFLFVLIVGSSNAVNLTDGLDGLATVYVISTIPGMQSLEKLCYR